MNRVLFFLLFVLSVACVGAVTAVEPSGQAVEERDPEVHAELREDSVASEAKSREGLETTQGLAPGPGRSELVGDPKGPEADLKGLDVDLKGPKVEVDPQHQRGKEERPAVDTQEVGNLPERGNHAGTSPNHQTQTSDSETTSRSPDTPSSAVLPTTSLTDEPTTVGDTSPQQIPSGDRSQDSSDQRVNEQGDNTQNTNTTRPENNDGEDSSASTT
ncbi:uncharacterized protein TM35_000511460 [Trypanosoma theileri]|uniref:Mucin-associated surface protein (MASP) n=1 Tax=Trypanosoma theileri TaxID=67003 RepID=A0A1X0NH44_9TRYP|nr:uncharacterized protein TM35_000511460 [Trypanosoma theileri]ORC84045.1 hypothetical protein TM35_000511460 [Trypanosoma theileri]